MPYKYNPHTGKLDYFDIGTLKLEDTAANNYLEFKLAEDLSANKILNWIIGDTTRTITLSGNPTLADWFDQPVKQASSPTFNVISHTGQDWTGGNVIYVPLSGDIQTYINNAVAGDTLILASGEYVITSNITVNKQLNIMGQGNAGFYTIAYAASHGTIISSVTAGVTGFNITSSNVRIAHLSINLQGNASTGIGTSNNLTGLVLTNIDAIVTCTGLAQGFMIWGSNAVLRNLTFYVTSTNASCSGLYVFNTAATTQDAIVDCFSVTGITKGTNGAGDNWSFICENNNCAKTITLNLATSVCRALAGTAADIAVASISAITNNAVVNCYLCELNGQDYDVYQSGTNQLNVGGSVLVNNLVFGTVTYRAAMAAGLGVFSGTVSATTAKLSDLTDDYIPYHVSDAVGLANGPTKTNVDSAISLKHAAVTVTAPIDLIGQAIKLVNDAAGTVTEIDTGVLANVDTVVPTSKAVTTAIAASGGLSPSLAIAYSIALG